MLTEEGSSLQHMNENAWEDIHELWKKLLTVLTFYGSSSLEKLQECTGLAEVSLKGLVENTYLEKCADGLQRSRLATQTTTFPHTFELEEEDHNTLLRSRIGIVSVLKRSAFRSDYSW